LELFASDGEIFALLVFLGLAVCWKKPNVLKCAVGSFFAWHTTVNIKLVALAVRLLCAAIKFI
jgi:hypothetical protein